ncbi:MAG: hypothetical protein GC191_01660 [Azospirillum sp.]|nr:hypothetical protein [Azospirillum sp.]
MRFIKHSDRTKAKVSLVLLDWSVRESLHIFHYLAEQTVRRDDFEVVIIEFYDTVSENIRKYQDQVDSWVVLDMPRTCYYHKHFMYNVGITVANGEIIMIGDSDAMVKSSFIESIIGNFTADPAIVYHMDQFRNMRRDFYPFNFPSFAAVLGDGCFNNAGGVTTGVLEQEDPIHARNYGACMCAWRKDLIAIGGADMHITYLGHICGPYDLTFRLINFGRREVWDMKEFLYHTWHPGQAGADNYMGPHDGRHMSTTALEALSSGRVAPLLENPAIRALREGKSRDQALAEICPDHYLADWDIEAIRTGASHKRWDNYKRPMGTYKGFRMVAEVDRVFAFPLTERDTETRPGQGYQAPIEGYEIGEVRDKIDAATPRSLNALVGVSLAWSLCRRALASLVFRAGAMPLPLPRPLKIAAAVPLAPFGLLALLLFRYRRLADKFGAVVTSLSTHDANQNVLAATLYNLGKWGGLAHDSQAVLVVSQDGTRNYLLLLQKLKLIPPLRVEVAPSSAQFGTVIAALEQDASVRRLLLPADLHARYHAAVADSKVGKHCLVL